MLTLDRPEQRNAVSRQMNTELHDAWRRFRDDDDAFVLVLTGAGSAFCAGWDLADAAEWPMPEWDEFRRSIYELPGACGYTRKVDVFKPVIAAVNGWAVAAGLETALLADIRIVAENAVFGALERRWNIVAGDGMTVRLPLAVGYAKAMELIITGRPVDAQEALRIGLANEVVPEGRALERAVELAREIAALPQGAIRTDKETMVRNVGRTLEEQLAKRGRGNDLDVASPRLARNRRPGLQGGPRPRVAQSRALSRRSGRRAKAQRSGQRAQSPVSTSASPIAVKNGSASERARHPLGDRELSLAEPEALAVVRHQVDAGQIGLGGHAALGERRDHRVAVGVLGQLDHVHEPAPPLGPAVRAGQHEAVGVALAGGAGADRGQALAVERGDPGALGPSSASARSSCATPSAA